MSKTKKLNESMKAKLEGNEEESGKMNSLHFDYTYQEEHVVVDRDNSSFIL